MSASTCHVAAQVSFLLHHTNHYALLFAMREWTEADGMRVRQVACTHHPVRAQTSRPTRRREGRRLSRAGAHGETWAAAAAVDRLG